VLTVGTIEPRKNLQRLFSAYVKARSDLPDGTSLVVAGPWGWGGDVVAPDGVYLAGRVEGAALASLYASAAGFAYVPLLEGFGLPPLEAMRAGVPVMASPVPSGGGAVLEVDPLDDGQIAEGLVSLCTDSSLRGKLTAAGTRRSSELTWARSAAMHVDLWRSLM
jgi:alpha-1,3-rhamnosyl/mannosyltransferase